MLHPIYYAIMIILTFASYRELSTGIKQKIFFVLFCIIFVTLAGIRVAQGADYWPYFGLYMSSNKYVSWSMIFDKNIGIEPMYVLLSKIIGTLGLPFNALLFTIAAISITLKGKTIYNFSPLPVFSLLCFFMPGFFASDMGHMRQALATAICMYSFKYISSKKLYKYLICLYLAYLSHKTAMVFIPAFWVANMKISTNRAILIIAIGVFLWPFEPYRLLGEWLNNISTENLATESFNSYSQLKEESLTVTEFVKIFFFIIIFVNDKYILNQNINENYMKVRNLIVVFYFFYYAFHGNPIFSIRLSAIYQSFDIILIAMIVAYSRYKNLIFIYYILYIYLISWRFWSNTRELGFDKFNTMFNAPEFNIYYFTPHEFYDEKSSN
ncbi:EpsG family protein [Apibacter sp. HY039]|uniref:EpsG family protein n=1 Tax=Apibacter sp. HY039 TaxID=2501476 RepID=UPI000FEBE719|nr:EpsG family protein [Apibacter sp. HY039]